MISLFDEIAATYHRIRPQYPPPLFDALFAMLPADRSPRVVEVGPGTGQATAALLARGAQVTAVELGPRMAAYLSNVYARQASLRVVNAAFEEAALPEQAWDLVFAATSYHWVRNDARIARPCALLSHGGVIAVVDTIQVNSAADRGFFERATPIYQRFFPGQRWVPSPEADVTPPIAEELRAASCFERVEVRRFRCDQVYGPDEYADLVRSYSNTAELAPVQREALIAALRAFVADEEGGFVVRPLVITLTTAHRT